MNEVMQAGGSRLVFVNGLFTLHTYLVVQLSFHINFYEIRIIMRFMITKTKVQWLLSYTGRQIILIFSDQP